MPDQFTITIPTELTALLVASVDAAPEHSDTQRAAIRIQQLIETFARQYTRQKIMEAMLAASQATTAGLTAAVEFIPPPAPVEEIPPVDMEERSALLALADDIDAGLSDDKPNDSPLTPEETEASENAANA